jgi:hypothetical protein
MPQSFTPLLLGYCRNRNKFDYIKIGNLTYSETEVAILIYLSTLKFCIRVVGREERVILRKLDNCSYLDTCAFIFPNPKRTKICQCILIL